VFCFKATSKTDDGWGSPFTKTGLGRIDGCDCQKNPHVSTMQPAQDYVMNSTSSAALLSLSSVARAAKIGLLLATVLASLAEIAPALAQQPNSAETQWSNTSRQATANHAGPVTPSAKLNAPYPPQIVGCHHLENGKWQEVPCASEEYIRKHHIPRPLLANSIQSTPHGFIVFPNHPSGGVTSTSHLGLG
jgi:hypothetical protein